MLARDRDAVPQALNLVDDRRPAQRKQALALLETLERKAPFPGAPRIGITGAPGVGKSTLLDALVRSLRPRGDTLAIIAVDPSSRESGGALLGDRIRVRSGSSDPGVLIRSMAARDRLGGLADSTRAGVVVLSAAFDRVFVETVGVGQSEVDVAALVDTLIYLVSPGAGDILQFMKAGILERPDIFVVNKADLGSLASRTAGELENGLALGEGVRDQHRPPVLIASARDGSGIAEIVAAMDDHREHLLSENRLSERRRRGDETFVLETLELRYGSYGLEAIGGRETLLARIRDDAPASAFTAIEALSGEIEQALRSSGRSEA